MKNARVTLCLIVAASALTPLLSIRAASPAEPETLTLQEIKAEGAKFKGTMLPATIEEEPSPKHPLFREYGTRTFDTFRKHPEIVSALKKLSPKFNAHTMATSDLSAIATVEGHTYLVLAGCYPHNCGGSTQLVAIEPGTHAVYLLQPTNVGPDTNPSGKFYLYGKPDASLRAAMCSVCPD